MPKLLLADDSVTIQRVIELTFADQDLQVLTAGDGEQAIALIQAERPDIVLADIGMPKRSGYEVAAFVKETPELSHIPVLLLTGAFEPVDEARARAAGCDGVLVKPFEPQHVIGRVRELLQRGANHDAASGGSVTRAVSDVPHPAEGPAPYRGMTGRSSGPAEDAAAAPEAGRPPRAADEGARDDYFDRLDAAFANMAGSASPRPSEPMRRDGPVLERDLDWFDSPPSLPGDSPGTRLADAAPQEAPPAADPVPVTFASPPGASARQRPQPPGIEPLAAARDIDMQASPPAATAPEPATNGGAAIAYAFSALLAAEQGEPAAPPERLGLTGPPPAITEELVDAIASRLMERLGAHAARDVVADIVSDVAERLVREEIGRIRSRQA